ncbi:hypothetical protein IWX78_001073 [Mycetocola sp. CAN_C7]|uniref:type IV toxin-antitoxin system AbiEi family antitoxin n=1 Tax=Mycetocola sp. CAN_C7 TaxID=2787724 RepID=UPI0018CB268B
MSSVPSVLTTDILPRAELSAACLDGELFAVDEAWTCADEPDRPELRAQVLASLLPRSAPAERLVMMGLTAAWLLGATDAPPRRHELCSRTTERVNLRLPPRFVIRELRIAGNEECVVGTLRVTTPVRTAFDLARSPMPTATELLALHRLVARFGIEPADETWSSLPGARRALGRIAAAGQPPLTR